MKTIVVAAAKGGVGKSTIAAILAVRAALEGKTVMADLNGDQGSLTKWALIRAGSNPKLLDDPGSPVEDKRVLEKDGVQFFIVDTPPKGAALIEAAIMAADVVVLPFRASILDVAEIDPIEEMAKRRGRPIVYVLNAANFARKALNESALDALDKRATVIRIQDRQPWIDAMGGGKVGNEIEPDLDKDVTRLWNAVATAKVVP